MNVSIIVPGGCSSNCKFCFWEMKKTPPDYIMKLYNFLDELPSGVHSLSITGSEPTESVHLNGILILVSHFKHKFTRVVMTTNGSHFLKAFDTESSVELLSESVDHLNISRHHYDDDKNSNIFNAGSNIIPSTKDVKKIINIANSIGIDVTFNCVLSDNNITLFDHVLSFIQYAKDTNASAITFRDSHESNTIEINKLEKMFDKYKNIHESSCGVCRIVTKIINGMKCNFHYSITEPTDVIDSEYEIVFQQTGVATLDWAGNKPYNFSQPNNISNISCDNYIQPGGMSGDPCSHGTYYVAPSEPCSYGCERPENFRKSTLIRKYKPIIKGCSSGCN